MRNRPPLDNDVSPAQLARRVDRLCDRFEAACKKGRRPRLERYLAQVPATARPELLRELLVLELEYRQEKGEKPALDEYHRRFPEHPELIDSVFGERGKAVAPSSYLLRKWAANRLVSQLRMMTDPNEDQSSDPPGALSLLARIVSRTASGEKGSGIFSEFRARSREHSEKTPDPFSPLDPPTKLFQPGNEAPASPTAKPDRESHVVRVLGDYELLNQLGKGGMGVVYRARQRSVNRIVALKVIRSDQLESLTAGERQEWFQRFRWEGQLAACLEHDNLVTIYEVGEESGEPFYSMRYVEGQSLADLLRQGPLANDRAALFLEQVARALHALHDLRGVVHRDLKPRNILVDGGGRPFLTDFGLAKWSQSTRGLTEYGACVGTPEYMAPEQTLNAAGVNAASDIYSLGATLYEMVAGRPPFKADNALETLRQVREEEPLSPRRLNPAVHRDLALICLKCLEKEPHKRYASALQVAEELRRYRTGEPLRHTRPVPYLERAWRWCKRKPSQAANAGLAALVLMAVTAISISIPFVHQLQDQQKQTLAARRESDRLYTRLALEGGQTLCEQGKIALGLFRWANGLTRAPEENLDLQGPLRAKLATYYRRINTLKGCTEHAAAVRAAVFGPGGLIAAITDSNRPLYIWEAGAVKDICLDSQPQARFANIALSDDGRMLAIAYEDGTAQMWDVASKQRMGVPLRHARGANCSVAFASDGRSVVTGSEDGTIQLWKVATGQPLGPPFQHSAAVDSVAVAPDGKIVAAGGKDGTVRLWRIETKEALCASLKHGDKVSALAFSPNSRVLMTGSDDRTAALWDVRTGNRLVGPLKHEDKVQTVAYSPDGRRVLTGSVDKTAQLWDAVSGQPIGIPMRHRANLYTAIFSPDGRTIVTAGGDQTIRLWDAVPRESRDRVLRHPAPVCAVAFTYDSKLVVTGTVDNIGRLWDASTGEPKGNPLELQGRIIAVASSSEGHTVLTVNGRTAQLWSLRTGKPPVNRPLTHENAIMAGALSPDGKTVLTASRDGVARLWKADTGEPFPLPPLRHDDAILAAAFSPDGETIATASMDGTARLWNAATGELQGGPLRHDPMPLGSEGLARKGWVWVAAFSPDGRKVLTASDDHTARLWDARSGEWLGLKFLHDKRITTAVFSPDGKKVLTGSHDHSARLWDAETGNLIAILQHQGNVLKVAFSPDSRFIATASADFTARIWDASTGEAISSLQHEYWVTALAFSPDGNSLITGSIDKTARLWRLPPPLPATAEQILLRNEVMTGQEFKADGTLQVLDANAWQQRRARLDELDGVALH
jgi:WD40 repeat protein/serine/threonine protein kinase